MSILESVLGLLTDNLPLIVTTIVGVVGSFVFKGRADKDDAVSSLKTGVAKFFQDNPEIKNALADGKISKEEWVLLFHTVGPVAVAAGSRGGAKVLRRWAKKGSVSDKYIEAVARELAVEFADKKILDPDGIPVRD